MHELDRLGRRLKYALRGVRIALKTEQSFRIQVFAAVVVIMLILWLRPTRGETVILLLVTALVLMLELVNSIFERMVDLITPRVHRYVEEIKDMMAASVLIASVTALVIGLIILLPRIVDKLTS